MESHKVWRKSIVGLLCVNKEGIRPRQVQASKLMPTHYMFEYKRPKELAPEDVVISSIPPERLADYLGLTNYGVEVLGLTQEDLLKVVAGMINQQ